MAYQPPEFRLEGEQLMFGKVNVGEVYKEVDGYYVWVPSPNRGGCFTEGDLTRIANFLKDLNKPWDDIVKAYFEDN